MTAPAHHWTIVRDGVDKTRLLEQRILEGALDPAVRDIACRLVQSAPQGAHLERLERLHRFVRDSPSYQREAVELFQPARLTLEQGGDCDDLTILLGSLGWALRYPFAVEPVGDPLDPRHYSLSLGWPEADDPIGDARTNWVNTEAAAAVAFGESSQAAARRRAVL